MLQRARLCPLRALAGQQRAGWARPALRQGAPLRSLQLSPALSHAAAAAAGGQPPASAPAAAKPRGRAVTAEVAEALADLDAMLTNGAAAAAVGPDAAESRGEEELRDLLAMAGEREAVDSEAEHGAEANEWGSQGGADLTDRSRDALTTSDRSRAAKELSEASRQEEIEDARRRYQRKRWAHNWVVKRTTDLHRRGADAAEVEDAIAQMITRGDSPTVITYNTLIAACGRGGQRGRGRRGKGGGAVRLSDARRAYRAYTELKRRGLMPTPSTYSALLTAVGRVETQRGGGRLRSRAGGAGGGGGSAEELFEKTWEAMAGYLSEHARGMVAVDERERTVLCNAALNAALRQGDAGKGRLRQMRDYMRVHDVGHDMVSFTVLLRGTKQELEEAVAACNASQATTRAGKRRRGSADAAAMAARAERSGVAALQALLRLWMEIGETDRAARMAGRESLLDGRLVNAMLASLSVAGRLIESDKLALTAMVDVEGPPTEPEPFPDDDEVGGGEYEYEDDEYDDTFAAEAAREEAQAAEERAEGTKPEREPWDAHMSAGIGEERRARQRKAIVAMGWQLWHALEEQMVVSAARRTRRDGSRRAKRLKQEEAEERRSQAHVLSSLMSVMVRAGGQEDVAAALQAVMGHEHVERDPVLFTVMMEACADKAEAEQCRTMMVMLQQRGIEVTTRHYNALLRAYARKGGDWAREGVWQQLHEMRDAGCLPDEYTISILLTASTSAKDARRAIESVKLAVKLAKEGHVRPTTTLLRHAHRTFNQRWGWPKRPQALPLLWELWACGTPDDSAEPALGGSEFPWWPAEDRPAGAEDGVGARVATVRAERDSSGEESAEIPKNRREYRRADDGSVEVDAVAVQRLLKKRRLARQRHDYEVADRLLRRLFEAGVVVDDEERVWAAVKAVEADRPRRPERQRNRARAASPTKPPPAERRRRRAQAERQAERTRLRDRQRREAQRTRQRREAWEHWE